NEVFSTELRLRKAASISTVLMSLIVGLGIFGLLSQSLARRKREIAVRKVLGAELIHIVAVFARQYALLIGLGLVIACPLAYLLTSNWLEQYAYRIEQSVWTYLSVILTIGLGSLLLIGLQCVKTALSNPVDSLKNE
ncbi:MAG TPA: FtsX-like permease family protein, partial [Flavitalea sp.]|nr:FtsX-like permease family protein [Flavitalea sp.]